MICEEPCNTADWSNAAENFAAITILIIAIFQKITVFSVFLIK